MLEKHFVVFCSPGSFLVETSECEISRWDIHEAIEMSAKVLERHGAKPYGFYFITKRRSPLDLDSKVTSTSKMYYLGGKVESYKEVCDRNDPKEAILRSNMENNNFSHIIVNTNSYKFTAPIRDGDTVLHISNGLLISKSQY